MEATTEAPGITGEQPERIVTLGGRTFRQSSITTVDRDTYMMRRYRTSGLAAFVKTFNPATDTLDSFGEKVYFEAFESGVLYEILAGMLVEDGVQWTRKIAAANAAFFANVPTQADKLTIYELAADVMADFLRAAAELRQTFLSSSEPTESPTTIDGGQPQTPEQNDDVTATGGTDRI